MPMDDFREGASKRVHAVHGAQGIRKSSWYLSRPFGDDGLEGGFDLVHLTHCLYFFLESDLDGLDESLRREIVQALKEICRFKDGRYFLFHPSGIFWIRKESR